ncbi:MAG: nucleotidyl transferase AbiEii/AbiGii toxin family protein, partial [Chitinophagales bacterium]
MLYTSTVAEGTLDILKNIFQIKELENFYLVGGTNLSLRYGHRISVDIDLFSTVEFENDQIIEILERNFQTFSYKNNSNPIGVFGFIDNVKIDLVRHHFFNKISETIVVDGIRMFGDQDIMAMKSLAILKRGVKKDFYDIIELLNYYSVEDFIISYKKKYVNNSIP